MISLQLGQEPPILIANAVAWGEEYALALRNGLRNPPERYRRNDIREALRRETSAKCAYCESTFEHVSYSHIEHILPKSRVPLLVCTWSNLTLACPICNNSKSSYYDENAPLLNPYADSVEAEVSFYGPMAIERSPRGKLTIITLKLNRAELLFERCEKLQDTLRILELLQVSGDNQAIKNALLTELRNRFGRNAEYASCVRCFVSAEGPRHGVQQ